MEQLSILVKTFLRPGCLENCLASIARYERTLDTPDRVGSFRFPAVVVVDDSDEPEQRQNQKIIDRYIAEGLRIRYLVFPYDSVGIGGGRNKGLDVIDTPYMLLCDDDFILCSPQVCSLQQHLQLLIEGKNGRPIDVLGGYTEHSASENQRMKNSRFNWLGFVVADMQPIIIHMFTDYYPDFVFCDIVTNFFIAKTEAIRKVRWNDDIHTCCEHSEFFYRAKIQNTSVAFTNTLFCYHYDANAHALLANSKYRKHRYGVVKYFPLEANSIQYYQKKPTDKLVVRNWGWLLVPIPYIIHYIQKTLAYRLAKYCMRFAKRIVRRFLL